MCVGGESGEREKGRERIFIRVFPPGKTIHAVTDEETVTGGASGPVPAGGIKYTEIGEGPGL